jgi:hypothetical protein
VVGGDRLMGTHTEATTSTRTPIEGMNLIAWLDGYLSDPDWLDLEWLDARVRAKARFLEEVHQPVQKWFVDLVNRSALCEECMEMFGRSHRAASQGVDCAIFRIAVVEGERYL